MKRVLISLTVGLALVAIVGFAQSQCSGPSCSMPFSYAGKTTDSGNASYRWLFPKEADGQTIYLFRGNEQIGGYNRFEHYYRPISGGAWGEICEPPIAPPVSRKIEQWMVQGVVSDNVCRQGREVYSINGREVSQDFAERVIEADSFPDDSGKGWLVVIDGDAEKRKKVVSEWSKDPNVVDLRGKTNVWSGPPDHMHMIDHRAKAPLYYTGGSPTVYYLNAGGEVLHRQDSYQDGDFKALRKIDPSYDPKKDVDLRKKGDSIIPAGGIPTWVWLFAIGAIGAVILYKNPHQPINA